SPSIHGPQSLLVHYNGDANDYISAYNKLNGIDMDLARVSLNLLEGESGYDLKPTMASDILLQKKIPTAPARMVNDAYAAKLLRYKQYINVDYSVNYIKSSSMVRVLRDKSGLFYVHYLIEPTKVSMERFNNEFFANLQIDGNVTDMNDKPIYQFTRKVPIKLESYQMDRIKSKLFSYQDMLPLIEGKYKINVLMRNTVSKEFTSFEKIITVPEVKAPLISTLTLAHRAETGAKYKAALKSFVTGGVQLLPSPRNDFVAGDDIYVYFQLYGLDKNKLKNARLKYTMFKNEEVHHTVTKPLSDYENTSGILEKFSLKDYSAAYYNINVSLFTDGQEPIAQREGSFYITPRSQLARPWVVSSSSASNYAENLAKLGLQYSNAGKMEKAYEFLEKGYNFDPLNFNSALHFCRLLNKMNKHERVITIGKAFMDSEEKHKFTALLGIACEAGGKYLEAVEYLKQYLAYYGTNLRILNLIGNCYHQLGNTDEALVAWEKSLELFPNQKKLKSVIDELKKTKQGKTKKGKKNE
ncbi:MAG: tetratricopeptide repeat protein, partial [bacterium]|nr:tetratricopeptide repeat protein [bacterium]